MKKIKFILTGLLSLFVFAGCKVESDFNIKDHDSKYVHARQAYGNLIGTTWKKTGDNKGGTFHVYYPSSVTFEEASISLGDTKYPFNQYDLEIEHQLLNFILNGTKYKIGFYQDSFYNSLTTFVPEEGAKIVLIKPEDGFSQDYEFDGYLQNNDDDNENNNSDDDDNNNEDTDSFDGTYEFTASGNRETDGSFTLSDGTWTYSGSKTNMAAQNGTYTVDGSKVTVQWIMTGGIEVEEIFTVSVNGSSAQWTLDDGMNSTFFNMLFGVAAQTELTFSYSE